MVSDKHSEESNVQETEYHKQTGSTNGLVFFGIEHLNY